jgi:hypothetical protein
MRRHPNTQGSSILEFAISLPFLVLMSVGAFAMGLSIDRHLTVTQLVRHAGNMYGRGVDFSQTQNQQLLLQAATGMNMSLNGGQGVVYLSTVVLAPPNGPGENRPNANLPVVAHRITIGNVNLPNSNIAMPTGVASNGEVAGYDDDNLSARATLPAGLTLVQGERFYFAEVFHTPTDIGFPGIFAPELLYSRAVF